MPLFALLLLVAFELPKHLEAVLIYFYAVAMLGFRDVLLLPLLPLLLGHPKVGSADGSAADAAADAGAASKCIAT